MLTTETSEPQSVVNAYFRKEASYWAKIYENSGIAEAIHQERLRATFAFVDGLRAPPQARALDIGCGAGFATVGLAKRGFSVESMDAVADMVEETRRRVGAAGEGARVAARLGDIHAIDVPDARFDLVVSLGVLPWLPSVETPLREMSRALKPGGHLIVSMDAYWQLRHLFDPMMNPLTRAPRALISRLLGRPQGGARARTMTRGDFRRALAAQGLIELGGVSLGFGPFTMFKRAVLPNAIGAPFNDWLQALANKGAPVLRATGSQYLILAKKSGAPSQDS